MSKGAVQRSRTEEGSDLWLWALGFMAAAGTGYGMWKHKEAKEREVAADQANKRAEAHREGEQTAIQHAQTMEANAAKERHRATLAEDRTRKLAMEVADHANHLIAKLLHETAPPLRFDGCLAAATDGVEIRIDMAWILSGIVDSAKEKGAIFGRIVGTVAHEWFHFQDPIRGTRPSHQEELCADKFAGKQLARLDVPPNHFADLLRVFRQSKTHPDGQLRADTLLNAWATENQKRERKAAELIPTLVTQPVTAAVPVVAQAPGRRIRNGAAKKSAVNKNSTTKTGAIQIDATKIAKTGTPEKRTKRSTPKKSSISATSN